MAGSPAHAVTVHPAVVELPLWAVWRTAHNLGVIVAAIVGTAVRYLDTYRNADPVSRRLTAVTVVLIAVMIGLAVCIVSLLV